MAAKKKGGGNLSRSVVVTVRLDPKLKFAAELVARKQRRTLSSFVEWAIERAVSSEVINPNPINGAGDTALEALTYIWDVEEADRFINFVERYPELLNFDEEQLWKIIQETPYFFRKVKKQTYPHPDLIYSKSTENILIKRVRENWKLLNEIAAGEENEDALPKLPENEIINNEIIHEDDEIPF